MTSSKTNGLKGILGAALLGLSVSAGHATDYTWQAAATANWNLSPATNWNPGAPATGPVAADNIMGTSTGSQLNVNTTRAVGNFTYNGSGLWSVVGNNTGGNSLDIQGTLFRGVSSGTLLFRQGNSTNQTLAMTIANINVSSGVLDLGGFGVANGQSLNSLAISGTTIISGGEIRINSVSNYTLGRMQVTSGTVTLNSRGGSPTIGATTTGINGSGGTILATYAAQSGTTNLTINNSVAASSSAILADGGGASSRLNITKDGSATQTLSGASTYSGATTVQGGVLEAGNANAFGTSALSITGSGSVLSSVSNLNLKSVDITSVGASLNIDGSAAAGSLTVGTAGDFNMSSGTLLISYNGGTADQIIGSATGDFLLTGGVIDLTNSLWNYGTTYQLFTGFGTGNVSGISFTNYNPGYTPSLSNAGVLSFAAVPEPSALALVALGGICALGRRRSRRQ